MNTDALAVKERATELFTYDASTGELRWRVKRWGHLPGALAGTTMRSGHRRVMVNGCGNFLVHRVVWLMVHGNWPIVDIDHINGDPGDNRLCNLRDVSRSVNIQNLKRAMRTNKSGLLGVTKVCQKWKAGINLFGEKVHLGTFDTPELAQEAYLKVKRHFHEGCTI
jgi:hypothetical protein